MDEVGAVALVAEAFASGLDAEALIDGAEAKTAGHAVVEEVEMAVFEFDDFSTIDTDEVIVVGVLAKVGVVGGLTVTEVNFVDEVGFDKEGEGAVDGGT